MKTRTTCPFVSRRLWMSQISSPRDLATRSAIARICSSGCIVRSKQKKWAQSPLGVFLRIGNTRAYHVASASDNPPPPRLGRDEGAGQEVIGPAGHNLG